MPFVGLFKAALTSLSPCKAFHVQCQGPFGNADQFNQENRPTNFLMIGNPGAGKSTILNGFMGKPAFKSGISYSSGMTYQFDVAEDGGHKFMDTPGLSDTEKRQQAAHAITKALKQSGYYKIFFVVVLESGRIHAEDMTTMKLVLQSAPITNYGVIINKLPPREYADLSSGGEAAQKLFMFLLSAGEECETWQGHVHLVKRDDELEGADNAVKPLPKDLLDFIRRTPGMEIQSENVKQIRDNEFEKQRELMEQHMKEMQENAKVEREKMLERIDQIQRQTDLQGFLNTLSHVARACVGA